MSFSVQRDIIALLENISSSNELKVNEKALYTFNTQERSSLILDIQTGTVNVVITNNAGD